ncbi:hypothetical protein ACGFIG_24805 [Micromonospora sp. NPDC049048]
MKTATATWPTCGGSPPGDGQGDGYGYGYGESEATVSARRG